MISNILDSPQDIRQQIAERARIKRLSLNFSQKTLSERSGVSWGVIKKFERTGKISLESLLKIALILGCLHEFSALFIPTQPEQVMSLDDLLKERQRKRGRE